MIKKLILIAALGLATVGAFAQGFRGMGGMQSSTSGLMRRDDVKAELALTDDQKTKIAAILADSRTKMQDVFRNANGDQDAMRKAMEPIVTQTSDDIMKVLTPDQQKRLKEIKCQVGGFGLIATDSEVQGALGVTAEQKGKIDDLKKTADAANASVFEKMRNNEIERPAAMEAWKKNSDALNSQIEAVLTEAQKTKFKDMQGKHFEQTSQPGGGRGGN